MMICSSSALKLTMASSRLRNSGVNRRLMSPISSPALRGGLVKPIVGLVHGLCARIGRHDDDDIAEVGLAPVVVGQRTVVHDLQQHVEDVRVRLLDFIEQQHTVRLLGDRLGQQATLVETDIARRRADQAADGMALHVLAHVEANQVDAHDVGQLLGRFGLADAGGAAEQEGTDRLVALAQTGAGHLDGRRQALSKCLVLPEHHALEVAFERLELAAVVVGHIGGRNARNLGNDFFDLGLGDGLLALADGGRMRCAAPASSMTSIALSGRWRSLMYLALSSAAACSAATAYLTLWCSSKRDLEALEDLHRLLNGRFDHVHLSGNGVTARRPSRRCRGTR